MGEVRSLGYGVIESRGLQVIGTFLTFAVKVENCPAALPSVGLPPTPSLPHCTGPLTWDVAGRAEEPGAR